MTVKNAVKDFVFDSSEGKITLPHVKKVWNTGFDRVNRHVEIEEKLWILLEAAADEETLALVDKLPTEESSEMMMQWTEPIRGEATPGE